MMSRISSTALPSIGMTGARSSQASTHTKTCFRGTALRLMGATPVNVASATSRSMFGPFLSTRGRSSLCISPEGGSYTRKTLSHLGQTSTGTPRQARLKVLLTVSCRICNGSRTDSTSFSAKMPFSAPPSPWRAVPPSSNPPSGSVNKKTRAKTA